MKTSWTAHLTNQDDINRFKEYVHHSGGVLRRLQDILHKDISNIEEDMESASYYEKPNLQDRLVRDLARKSEIRRIINLLEV